MGLSLVPPSVQQDPALDFAIAEILATYGHRVYARKSLIKYGTLENFGATETLIASMGQNETYVSTNSIDTISSSSGSDTGSLYVEGHTIDANNDLTFVVQTKAMTGQTKAVLDTPLARVSRVRYLVSGADAANAGDIYVYEDDTTTTPGVPDTASKIHLKCNAGEGSSLKAATSFSYQDYFVITGIRVGLTRQSGNGLATFRCKYRVVGNNFLTQWRVSCPRDSGPFQEQFKPYYIVRPNSDIIITAQGSTTGLYADAQFDGYICTILE